MPRHSWLGSAGGGGVWSRATPGCGPWLPLPATPGWGLLVAVGVPRVVRVSGVSGCAWWFCCCAFCVFVVSALLVVWCGGVVWVCLPLALVCVVACAWCVGGLWLLVPTSLGWGLRLVFIWVWLVCVVGPPPLLAEGSGCSAPLLLAGVCRFVVVVDHSPLVAEGFGCGAQPLLAGVRRRVSGPLPLLAKGGGGGSPPLLAGVRWWWWCGLARHSCFGPRGALLLVPGVCVCAVWRPVLVWVVCGDRVRCDCFVCVCVRAVCGLWGLSYLVRFASSVDMVKARNQKKRSCRRVAETCVVHAYLLHTSLISHRAFFPCRERACAGCWGVGWVWRVGSAVLPLPLRFFPFFPCFLVVLYLSSFVACYVLFLFFS